MRKLLPILLLLVLSATKPAQASDAPRLRAGLWTFETTHETNGEKSDRRITNNLRVPPETTRCVDPNAALKKALAPPLGRCRSSTTKQNENELVVSTRCGSGEPIKTTIKIEGPDSYTEIHEGTIGAARTKEVIVGRRIGDCRG